MEIQTTWQQDAEQQRDGVERTQAALQHDYSLLSRLVQVSDAATVSR